MIISTIEGLKLYLGRAINSATTLAFILPYIEQAQDEVILLAVGPEILSVLEDQQKANNLTPANQLLMRLLQKALAWYSYQKYLPFSLGTDGDFGMQEQETDKGKPVRMGVLDVRRRETAENAAKALETALFHLFTFADQYPAWKTSATYTTSRSLFICSATELTEQLPQAGGSYRLLLSLKPYLSQVERRNLLPLLGAEQFFELKSLMLNGGPMSDADQQLLDQVRQANATVAYAKAMYHLNVVQTSGGALRILSDFDGIYNQKAVTGNELENAQRKADSEAAASLNTLKEFLTKNADLYPLYKNSDRYSAPGPNTLPNNSLYKGVFRMQ